MSARRQTFCMDVVQHNPVGDAFVGSGNQILAVVLSLDCCTQACTSGVALAAHGSEALLSHGLPPRKLVLCRLHFQSASLRQVRFGDAVYQLPQRSELMC
jgi:hypothetical protein